MISHKRLETITKADLETLIENRVSENRSIEYKEELPGKADEDRREFAADVSSFANTGGGDILYGVVEERIDGKKTGRPERITGVRIVGDDEITRLENIARDAIEPRVSGLQFVKVDGFSSGPVLIARVPKSWRAPHMVVVNHSYRCFARAANGKYPRDVGQIREAFLMSGTLRERINAFRSQRLERIRATPEVAPLQLLDGGRIVLHVIPIAGFDSPESIQLDLAKARPTTLQGSAYQYRYNFDGVLGFDQGRETTDEFRCSSYVQLFRNGSIEATDAGILSKSRSRGRQIPDSIPSVYFEEMLIRGLASYFGNLIRWEVPSPLVVTLSLLNVKGFVMLIRGDLGFHAAPPIDRDDLLTSEVFVDEIESDDLSWSQAERILKGPLDHVWQAAGQAGSLNYDDTGRWAGKR